MLIVDGSILPAMVDLIHAMVEFLNLFFAGVLAGEEWVICYGVRTVVAVLDQEPQIQLRPAIIRKLRAPVPTIFVLTALSGIAAMSLDGTGAGFRLRCVAALGLLVWVVATWFGTPAFNKNTPAWPFDRARCWAAVISFAFWVAAVEMA